MQSAQELFDAFRSDVVDNVRPYLWTDDEVTRYADDAYQMFVRLTGGIADFTSDFCSIALSVGTDTYELSKRILHIKQVTRASDGRDVKVINYNKLDSLHKSDYGLTELTRKNSPGPVRYLLIGRQRGVAQTIQIPTEADTLTLDVLRKPLDNIVDGSHLIDEIDSDHHSSLLLWMKRNAYLKQDAETFDKSKSEECEVLFRNYCTQVTNELGREKHTTRVVAYGGL